MHGTDAHDPHAPCETGCPLAAGAAAAAARGEHLLAGAGGAVDRRTFLSHSVLAAASLALAACGADGPTAPSSVNGTVTVGNYPALASTGGIALVNVGGAALAIVRTGTSSFVALSRVCPHQGTTVNTNASGGFTCPRHSARFSSTGTWLGGQRTGNMRSYATSYDAGTGVLTIG